MRSYLGYVISIAAAVTSWTAPYLLDSLVKN